jgi:hypothetical protein
MASQQISFGIGSPASILAFVTFGLTPGAFIPTPTPETVLRLAAAYTHTITLEADSLATLSLSGAAQSTVRLDGAVE